MPTLFHNAWHGCVWAGGSLLGPGHGTAQTCTASQNSHLAFERGTYLALSLVTEGWSAAGHRCVCGGPWRLMGTQHGRESAQ